MQKTKIHFSFTNVYLTNSYMPGTASDARNKEMTMTWLLCYIMGRQPQKKAYKNSLSLISCRDGIKASLERAADA